MSTDPRIVSVVATAGRIPWFLAVLPAGVVADRFRPVRIVCWSQIAQSVVVLCFTSLLVFGRVGVLSLAVVSFLATTGDVFSSVASQALTPSLVGKDNLAHANGLMFSSQVVGYTIVGQSLGGFLGPSGGWAPFALDGSTYVMSALLLWWLPRGSLSASLASPVWGGLKSVMRDMSVGVAWLWRTRLLRALTLTLAVNSVANQISLTVLVLFATQLLHISGVKYGIVVSASAIGSLSAGFVVHRIADRFGPSRCLIMALSVNAVSTVATGWAFDSWSLAGLVATYGFSVTVWNVVVVTLRQSLSPQELLGRVSAANRLLGFGLSPLGALAGGFLAGSIGLRWPFAVAGGLRAFALVAVLPILLCADGELRGS